MLARNGEPERLDLRKLLLDLHWAGRVHLVQVLLPDFVSSDCPQNVAIVELMI